MASQKTSFVISADNQFTSRSNAIPAFVWKSVGAALCGAAIPGVIFYFLF